MQDRRSRAYSSLTRADYYKGPRECASTTHLLLVLVKDDGRGIKQTLSMALRSRYDHTDHYQLARDRDTEDEEKPSLAIWENESRARSLMAGGCRSCAGGVISPNLRRPNVATKGCPLLDNGLKTPLGRGPKGPK